MRFRPVFGLPACPHSSAAECVNRLRPKLQEICAKSGGLRYIRFVLRDVPPVMCPRAFYLSKGVWSCGESLVAKPDYFARIAVWTPFAQPIMWA